MTSPKRRSNGSAKNPAPGDPHREWQRKNIGILVKRKALEKPKSKIECVEVINIDFDMEKLEITILIDGNKLVIAFDSPVGFRVLDEGDLLEFWPHCSSPNGWLYKIMNGGWLEQESQRSGFLSGKSSHVSEYFIVGTNYCVGVLSENDPVVTESVR